jgi:uncharacterized membrane protein YfcA/uncharacterized membrane protein YedE/YeeE
MMILTAILSALMGLTLGVFGGGGSILAVPLLVYVVGVSAKASIATSLLVVGATSAVCAVQHARAGHVRYKTAVVFGGVAMVGAYGGGMAAAFVSGSTLLWLFAAMMVVAGGAMMRRPKDAPAARDGAIWKIALEGLVVGAVTGLVGAGGGFLVVPALVLWGGLDMRAAVGTSTLVIAMKAFAGFAGHATHVAIDYQLAALVIAFASAGSLVGTALLRRLDPSRLRRAFGVFVIAMAAVIAYQEASPELLQAVFVERWPFWAGGAAIGAFVLAFLALTGKALGVSTGYLDACAAPFDTSARRSWRIPFLVGIVVGGLLAMWAAGGAPTMQAGIFEKLFDGSVPIKAAVFGGGGVLLGFGARLAGGCTSGHGIVGMAQGARSSLMATALFMVAGFVVTNLMFTLAGG